MVQEIDIGEFLKMRIPGIDVRSPGEYNKAHIPDTANIPLFSDEERAHVGTVYVQKSREKAIELGYQYVNPKLKDFIAQSKEIGRDGKVVVHCWRGGMRSRSFAEHLNNNGFAEVFVLKGGYKAYRKQVLLTFDLPFQLKIIGGYTGSGKTGIIQRLRESGFQAVDLEYLAKHKGSAFGALQQIDQPSVEQFENDLFETWRHLDFNQPIWLEDESHNIGGVNIPMNLYNQMRQCPVYFLDIPKEVRARHLVREYADVSIEFLTESIRKISKRLDGQKAKEALQFLNEKKFYEVAYLALGYYDKSYLKGMKYRNQANIYPISGKNTDPIENTKLLLQFYKQHEQYQVNPI